MGIGLNEYELELAEDEVSMRWSGYRTKWVWDGVGTG